MELVTGGPLVLILWHVMLVVPGVMMNRSLNSCTVELKQGLMNSGSSTFAWSSNVGMVPLNFITIVVYHR